MKKWDNLDIQQGSYGKGQNWTVKVQIFDKYWNLSSKLGKAPIKTPSLVKEWSNLDKEQGSYGKGQNWTLKSKFLKKFEIWVQN